MTTLVSTREQRRRKLGVDCPDRITWKGWEAGEEYPRTLCIKNVEGRPQTITFQLPERKATFLTPFPEPITLSSGVSFDLDIRFCPTDVQEILDCIEVIVSGRGSFVVYLQALAPFARLKCTPSSFDFDFCPVSVAATETVKVENTGTVPVEFHWDVPAPFSISPARGHLHQGESVNMVISFTPREAAPVLCQGICMMNGTDEVVSSIRLSGVGKYPYVRFDYKDALQIADKPPKKGTCDSKLEPVNYVTALMDFKEVHAGCSMQAEFFLENPSPVAATVTLRREDDNLVCPFRVSPATALIPRGGRQRYTVTYKAKGTGTLNSNRFHLSTLAGSSIFLEVRGSIIGPRVRASTSSINYGDVNLDKMPTEKELTRYVQLKNHSKCPAHFQFVCTSPGAAFVVEPTAATIDALESLKVKITFRPTMPMNFLRRLLILVQDSSDVLYLDVFGTGYNSFVRPLPFDLPQIEAFFLRMERGLGLNTPQELEAVATSVVRGLHASSSHAKKAQAAWESIAEDVRAVESKSFLQKRSGRMSFRAYLESAAPASPFTLEGKVVSFDMNAPRAQSVVVSNSSTAMAVGAWCLPANSPFTVTPEQQDIPPGGSAAFVVTLASTAGMADGSSSMGSSAPSAEYIECYVSYKQMRSFRLVSEESFIPPHCLVVQCRREYPSQSKAIAAEAPVTVDSVINFPACAIHGSSYQVVSLFNNGDVVAMYEVKNINLSNVSDKVHDDVANIVAGSPQKHSSSSRRGSRRGSAVSISDVSEHLGHGSVAVFHCHPPTGMLPPQQRQLVLLEFTPNSNARFEGEGILGFNHSNKSTTTVHLRGEAFVPCLRMEAGPLGQVIEEMVLQPTCVSAETRQMLRLFNPTSLRVAYEFVTSDELVGVVRVEPSSGVLEGYERQEIAACFSPEVPRRYEGCVSVILRTDSVSPSPASTTNPPGGKRDDSNTNSDYLMTWRTVGEGVTGIVEMAPNTLDCGDIAGLEPQTVSLTLYNSSMCELNYEVRSITCKEPADWRRVSQPPTLRNHVGTLPARSHAVVLVTVHPSAGLSEFLLYAMFAGPGTTLSTVSSPTTVEEAERHPHCRLSVKGTRPAVQVVDVRSLTQQRSHLWRQLSINELNHQLASPVHPSDVEKVSYAFYQYVEGLVPVAMELAVNRQNAIPANISIMLENSGDCPASFNLWLPMDNSVSQETWYLDDEELKSIQAVLDKGIINITPRSGTIPVGGSVTITVTYRFDEVGIHTLPVVLRINDGKKALLVVEGRTVPVEMDCLTSHHNSLYNLLPVALGDVEPPMQSMLLENPLDREVTYQVDTKALRWLADSNYGFPILQCVNPSGTLAPRSLTTVLWYFRPLEAKEYSMPVPIHTGSGESYSYTFVGRGYHPKRVSKDVVRQYTEEAMLALPHSPALKLLPVLPISLSTEVIRLGAVPYFGLYRRCCTLRNDHPTDTYGFQWDPRHDYGDHVFSISPSSGTLPPGAEVDCRINFYTGSTSQLLEWSMPCHIRNESAIERAMVEEYDTEEVNSADGVGSNAATASVVYAADGVGELVNKADHGFTRPTCTKRTYQPHAASDTRLPVTTIPLESLGIPALAARLAAARRKHKEGGAANTEAAVSSSPTEAVMWNCLELLVQAHVMPVEEYERLHGSDAVQRTFQPVIKLFQDPMDPLLPEALPSASLDEARVARDMMDELLRAIVAQPKVQSAFTEPYAREVICYEDLLAATARSRDADAGVVAPDDKKSPAKQEGFMQNVLEEALEEMLFQVARNAVKSGAVIV